MPMIEIEKPADEPLGAWFEALRGWLDHNGRGSVTFARVGKRGDRSVYRLAFADVSLAEKFSHTFAAYLTAAAPEIEADEAPEFVTLDTLGEATA